VVHGLLHQPRNDATDESARSHLGQDRWRGIAGGVADDGKTGEQIYRQLCAKCHGAMGEGDNEHYPQPLAGDRSVSELARYIDKSMPENEPEKCDAEESRRVAAYIYDAFYSPIAQARIKPPRIELARLTVRQYRQSLADLVGSFRGTTQWGSERGLKGEYFKNRRMRNEDRAFERIDSVVKFDSRSAGRVRFWLLTRVSMNSSSRPTTELDCGSTTMSSR
jgi:hypothetical protein